MVEEPVQPPVAEETVQPPMVEEPVQPPVAEEPAVPEDTMEPEDEGIFSSVIFLLLLIYGFNLY